MTQAGAVEQHWTRRGVLERIDAALVELGHDPHRLTPDILASVEHLHTGGLETTRDQAERISLTTESRVLDVGCGLGGPARHLAHTYGCRVEGIDLTGELIEAGRVLSERCGLAERVRLQVGNALDLPYPDESFDVVWCQNVTMNIADKARFLANVHRVLKRGGLLTSTEFSLGSGGAPIYPLTWAADASLNFLDSEGVMRAQLENAGFTIRDWINYTDIVVERFKAPPPPESKRLPIRLVLGDDLPERQRNTLRNLMEKRIIYWMIVARRG